MREILFRGKFEPLHSWIYGDLVHDGGTYIAPADGRINLYPADPDTVGQYTGLKDKNGKKIFEGDILKEGDRRYFVEFSERMACFRKRGIGLHSGNLRAWDSYEIIGNIYDNPELMEGESNERD